MNANLSVNGVKKLAKDKTLAGMVAKYLVKKAKAKLVREKVDAYIRPVFEKYEFYVGESRGSRRGNTGERITDENRLYLCEDEELCNKYYTDCHEAHLSNEFACMIEGKEPGYCPALIAESEFNKAASELTEYARKHFGMPEIYKLDMLKKLEEMTVSLIVGEWGEKWLRKTGEYIVNGENIFS